jgi:hypothetical protein
VNAIRRRRYRTVKSGQLPGKPTSAPWSRSVFLGSIRPEIGRPIRGARGDHYPPRYRQENRGRLPRALSAPLPALLAPHYRIISHNSARIRAVYIRTRQPAGAPLRQAWNVNTEGNCIRERDCVAYGNLASDGTAHGATTSTLARRGQHRHRTARVHVADYANPATLTNTIGTAHGAITSALAKREKSRKYLEVSQTPLAGITPGLPRGRTAHGNRRDLPRIGTARIWSRG